MLTPRPLLRRPRVSSGWRPGSCAMNSCLPLRTQVTRGACGRASQTHSAPRVTPTSELGTWGRPGQPASPAGAAWRGGTVTPAPDGCRLHRRSDTVSDSALSPEGPSPQDRSWGPSFQGRSPLPQAGVSAPCGDSGPAAFFPGTATHIRSARVRRWDFTSLLRG